MLLRRKCIRSWLDGIFYKCPLSKLLIVLLRPMVSLFNFCLEDLSSGERGVLKSPSIIVLWSIRFLELRRICLMYMDKPMLGA